MKPYHPDAIDRHARFIAAFCEDLASPDFRRAGETPLADALARNHRPDGPVTTLHYRSSIGRAA